MSGPVPLGATVSYRRQYRRCGKATCTRCAAGGPGHGPYWYAFWWADGHTHSRYLGKQAPTALEQQAPPGVTPTDAAPLHLAPPAPAQTTPTPTQITSASAQITSASAQITSAITPDTSMVLRVRTLGGFAVWRDATALAPAQWHSQRATTLFKCLLSAPSHRLPRERAAELLWPEGEPEAGTANLRTTIHLLRQVLDGPDAAVSYIQTSGDMLVLAPGGATTVTDDWLDATAFAHAAQAALAGHDTDACRAALVLYGGEYLPDDPYAEWALAPRAALRQQYLALLLHLATLSGARGALAEAEECLREVLVTEPGHEEATATLMRLLAESGRRSEALRVYQELTTVLEQELEVAPSAEVTALRARLVAQEDAPLAALLPRQHQPPRLSNLPLALTSFVGRTWELGEVTEMLATTRLVTLTGPGGCGKTRLALEAAERLVETDGYPDGVWLVELAALADPALVPQTVAATLSVAEKTGQPLTETLVAFLQPRRTLLVLDNCEHLLAACAELATRLLLGCPHLRLLTTSREGLAVAGEGIYLVPSLTAPDPAHLPPLEQLGAYEAVMLFRERARARRPEFTLTAATAEAVTQICARLDGLPLAIELAAARVGVLPVEAIAARLHDRFRLLTGGSRTALPRQQTLRATLDWSYALLSPSEQRVLSRLAVFAGGWTLDAAEAVCMGEGVAEQELLDLLSALVSKSLVQAEAIDGQLRYRLLETVRQYGLERLAAAGEEAAARDAHAAWCVELAEQAAPLLRGREQSRWLRCLEAEHDNMRTALIWSLRGDTTVLGLQLAGALWRFWYARGYLTEGRRWLESTLAACEGKTPPAELQSRARTGVWSLAWQLSQITRELCEADLAHVRELNDTHGIAAALERLAGLAYSDNDYEQARRLHGESLALRRALNDREGIAASLEGLGDVAYKQGELERSWALHGESVALRRELGDQIGIANVLSDLARVAYARDDLAQARGLAEEALALYRELGVRWGVAYSSHSLGLVAYASGEYARARTLFEQCLRIDLELDNWWGVTRNLEGFARLLAALGRSEGSARLWAAADSQRLMHNSPRPPSEQAEHDRAIGALRAAWGEEPCAAASAAGLALTLQEAVGLALTDYAAAE